MGPGPGAVSVDLAMLTGAVVVVKWRLDGLAVRVSGRGPGGVTPEGGDPGGG
ncbi:MAG: hypothetical protein QOJ52_2301 [Acidimicrobiaceae bacterium]|nr:hypothetical protein [Acidimicrobiaceae bacterium]